MGYAFTAIIGVDGGKIVDGLEERQEDLVHHPGSMDSELAVRLGNSWSGTLSGGAKDMSGKNDLTPEEMAAKPDEYSHPGICS